MSITKRTFIDQITVEPVTGNVFWRETTVLEEDGKELSRVYNRSSISPAEDDVSRVPAEVEPFRAAVQTAEKKAAAKAKREQDSIMLFAAKEPEPQPKKAAAPRKRA